MLVNQVLLLALSFIGGSMAVLAIFLTIFSVVIRHTTGQWPTRTGSTVRAWISVALSIAGISMIQGATEHAGTLIRFGYVTGIVVTIVAVFVFIHRRAVKEPAPYEEE